MLSVIKLLQLFTDNKQLDCSIGLCSRGSKQIQYLARQKKILRVNCADSLDRTNLVLFHLVQVFNSININFIME